MHAQVTMPWGPIVSTPGRVGLPGSGECWSLWRGDALAWLASLPDECADALVTDPPYSSGGLHRGDRAGPTRTKYQTTGTTRTYAEFAGDNRDQRSWIMWMSLWLGEALRVLRPGAPAVLFTDWRQLPATTDALQAAGLVWRGVLPWDKTEAVRPHLGRFRAQAEYAVWGSKGQMDKDRTVLWHSRTLPGAFRIGVKAGEKRHVTGKPVELLEGLVRICEPGGLILDPFAGSGTTGVAALRLGYRFAGCEMVPEICEIAREWLTETESARARTED